VVRGGWERGAPGSGFGVAVYHAALARKHPNSNRAGEQWYARRRGLAFRRIGTASGQRIFTERETEADVNQLGIWLVVAAAVAEPPVKAPDEGVTTTAHG
jgi:hypothetical protein